MKNFQITGRLGTKPTLNSKGDTQWTNLNIAVNNGGDDNPDWFWVTAFGKLAVACAEYLNVGDGVSVSGAMRSKKVDGKTRYDFIAREADFFFKNSRQRAEEADAPGEVRDGGYGPEVEEDEIPF